MTTPPSRTSILKTAKNHDFATTKKARFYAIFKMHVLESGVAIFGETSLNWTTPGYCRLIEFQLSYSFLHHFSWPVNMANFTIFALWDFTCTYIIPNDSSISKFRCFCKKPRATSLTYAIRIVNRIFATALLATLRVGISVKFTLCKNRTKNHRIFKEKNFQPKKFFWWKSWTFSTFSKNHLESP